VAILFLATGPALAGCAVSRAAGDEAVRRAEAKAATPAHADRFADSAGLKAAVDGAARVVEDLRLAAQGPNGAMEWVAAVVPHHLVAGHLPAGLLAYLRVRPPETLVIVGPDHFGRGPSVGTDYASWRTAWGDTAADDGLVSALLEAGLAQEAWTTLDGEHSIGALMPLVKLYLPETRVVALTLRRGVTLKEAAVLGSFLREWTTATRGDVFVVASVDFSHYLPRSQAEDRDELTLAALTRADWPTLFGMGPSNLDSPGALAVAFAFAGKMEQTRFQVVEHTNSAGLLGRPDLPETTSHFLLTIARTDP